MESDLSFLEGGHIIAEPGTTFEDFFKWADNPVFEEPPPGSRLPVGRPIIEQQRRKPTQRESNQVFAMRQSRPSAHFREIEKMPSRGIDWYLDQAIKYGPAVYQAVAGGGGSGKGETVTETSEADWYTADWHDQGYATVPTRRQMGLHGHPHPRGLVHRRRRRRKLLTASDKADIAFITGTLGKGEMGRTAIAALLSRRMS